MTGTRCYNDFMSQIYSYLYSSDRVSQSLSVCYKVLTRSLDHSLSLSDYTFSSLCRRSLNTASCSDVFFHPVYFLRYKPALASSEAGLGVAGNAVDGIPTIVHEGRKCSETRKEKSPWWTVDLLTVQVNKAFFGTPCRHRLFDLN